MKYIYSKAIQKLVIFTFILCIWNCSKYQKDDDSSTIKVAVRDVGHKLLLSNQDSISLVNPILKLDDLKYQLSFENDLTIHPDSLVSIIRSSFHKSDLSQYYLTEVVRCIDEEVAYSYEMKDNVEKGIVPCGGRELKKACYKIIVKFTQSSVLESKSNTYLYIIVFGVLLIIGFTYYRIKSKANSEERTNFTELGTFKFYPDQNKLVKQKIEIELSRKECELLAILAAKPNHIITRDELTKKVWEDNGVIVGRSLDTYISKLRKKLQADASIKITNIHGVGYKLETI